jgi:hypothetical protein
VNLIDGNLSGQMTGFDPRRPEPGNLPAFEKRPGLWYRSPAMMCRVYKFAAVVFLCGLFLFSGVAWALDACLQHDTHPAHAHAERHDDAHPSSDQADNSEHSGPIVHCTSPNFLVGPAALLASPQLSAPSKTVQIQSHDIFALENSVARGFFRANALIEAAKTFSARSSLSHRLFLSILQI